MDIFGRKEEGRLIQITHYVCVRRRQSVGEVKWNYIFPPKEVRDLMGEKVKTRVTPGIETSA